MGVLSWFAPGLTSDDTTFRAWATGLSNGFAAFLTKTADTGQVSLPFSFAKPAAGAVAGYEIFRFNDTQQSSLPIFFKVEYGMHGTTANQPSIWLTFGTGSDGAGTITGTTVGRTRHGRSTAPAGGNLECGASGGAGYFNMFWNTPSDANGGTINVLTICRNVDISGVPTASAYWVLGWADNATNFYTIPQPPTPAVVRTTNVTGNGLPFLFCPENTNTAEYISLGGEVPVYPVEPFLGRRQPPMIGYAFVHQSDVGGGVIFQTLLFSATMTFRRVHSGVSSYGSGGRSGVSAACLAIRWE